MNTIKKYNILKLLKSKTDAKKTFLVQNFDDKELYILKRFDCRTEQNYLAFLREKSVNIKHPAINELSETFKEQNFCYVIRPYIDGKNLMQWLKPVFFRKRPNNKLIIWSIIRLLDGIEALHLINIIHRDIRPQNIIIQHSVNQESRVVLIDFEQSKIPKLSQIDKLYPFSFIYSPPEQVLRFNDLVNETSDLFSLGISLWILFTGKVPFEHKIPEVLANLQITYPLPYDKKIPATLWQVIKKATFKHNLKKPPRYYNKQELYEILKDAQRFRYQSAKKMKEDLLNIL